MRETRRDDEDGAGARSARATRAPRLLVSDELNTCPDRTPWDIYVELDEVDDWHTQVWGSPALHREDASLDISDDDLEAGYKHFRGIARAVVSDLAAIRQQVADRHTACHGSEDDCRRMTPSSGLTDDFPPAPFTVPTAVAEAWLRRVAEAFRDHLDAQLERSA